MRRALPCKLTEAEVLTKGAELAQLCVAIDDQVEELKLYAAGEREKIKSDRSRAADLARAVATRSETRDVECYEVPDPATDTVIICRRDTGERVDARPMTAADRQLELMPGGKVVAFDARSGEPSSERSNERASEQADAPAHERAHERPSVPPTCACDHAPAEHANNEEQLGWGACQHAGCVCNGSNDARALAPDLVPDPEPLVIADPDDELTF